MIIYIKQKITVLLIPQQLPLPSSFCFDGVIAILGDNNNIIIINSELLYANPTFASCVCCCASMEARGA